MVLSCLYITFLICIDFVKLRDNKFSIRKEGITKIFAMHLQFERKNVRLWLFYFYISLSCQPTNAVLVQDGIIGTAYQL